ncbi:MAG TPA: TIGR02679 family protein [Trebonia sp.]|nr:TIGR02679 family protein [Trebonia sp.]
MTEQRPCARYAGPGYARLLSAARRSLERTGGDLSAAVTVRNPDDEERKAIIGITGQYRAEGAAQIGVRLADLDRAVREADGQGLIELLERIGPPLKDRPADRRRLADGREATVRSAESSFLNVRDWYQAWLTEITADGTLTRLVNAADADRVGHAVRVLETIARRTEPVQLAELAAATTGDTKALNHGTTLATLVLRALALQAGVGRPVTTEQRRDLWDAHGVIVDDLASRVLVLNLAAAGHGLGEWLTDARARGVPFYVTLQQLIAMPVVPAVAAEPIVHVCENPAVLRRAAADLGPRSRPLICTEGQPSTAFHRLVGAVTANGGALRYHGDFDWPGIAIANSVISRHDATPWRLTAGDYLGAVREDADHVTLSGPPQPTPWDPALADAMTATARAVYEESVAAPLIADLDRQLRSASERLPNPRVDPPGLVLRNRHGLVSRSPRTRPSTDTSVIGLGPAQKPAVLTPTRRYSGAWLGQPIGELADGQYNGARARL